MSPRPPWWVVEACPRLVLASRQPLGGMSSCGKPWGNPVRSLYAPVAAFAALCLLAGAAFAGDAAWVTVRNDDLGYSIEGPPGFEMNGNGRANGDAPPLMAGQAKIGPDQKVVVVITDAAKDPSLGHDADKDLEKAVATFVTKFPGVIDSRTPVRVDGAPGMDLTGQAEGRLMKMRIVVKGTRMILIIGAGEHGQPAPGEFDRMAASLHFLR
jgi:hypothetical protein